jgi:hypothetical protein
MHSRIVGAAAAGTLLMGLLAAAPAQARGSLECYAEVPGVTARGVPTTYLFEAGHGSSQNRGPGTLGYQPRDVAYPHHPAGAASPGLASRASAVTSYWFTLAGSELREVREVDLRDATGLLTSASYRTRVVHKHWAGVRQISIGRDRDALYVLTNTDQLLRYRLSGPDGSTTAKLDDTIGIGFGSIGTFEYARSTNQGGEAADVFLATDADSGELLEFTIPLDDPTAYTRTVLASEGWGDLRSAGRTASCLNPRSGRSYDGIVTVDLDGNIRLWTDRHARDGDGSDIVRRGVLKTGWKPLAYND